MKFNLFGSCLAIGSLMTLPAIAQMNNPDDLPNNTTQMKTWYCTQENQRVLVEEKMVKDWQPIIEGDSGQCVEQLANIPDNAPQFTCEGDESQINLITVTWLKGNQAQSQMKNWMKAFGQENMICTVDQTNPFLN